MLIAIATAASLAVISPAVTASSVGSITGETSRTTESIKLPNGADSGVLFTTVNFTGHYGSNKVLHVAEADLSNTHLSIDVINCGEYTVSKEYMTVASKAASVNGKTVLAAVNGDLWMTSSYSNAKSTLAVSRGSIIIDREIWATQEIYGEAGIAGLKDSFGITSKNQPIVGEPEFKISMTNTTRGITLSPDGLNRLPAKDAIIVYNNRVNSSNYALNEAYEVELEASSTAFSLNGTVSATVKAIYPQNSATRPAIGKNTILLSARGTKISQISSFKVGDKVNFSMSVTDRFNSAALWYDVVDAISGHMMPLCQGVDCVINPDTSEYPMTLIGINDSGKVLLSTITASTNKAYKGLRHYQAREFCRELGYNSVFYLDGGGSATMVTLKNGTYTARNCFSDGAARKVINGVAITWNQTPVCEKQGSLSYIRTPVYLTDKSPEFIDGALLPDVMVFPNDVSVTTYENTAEAEVKAIAATNDPFFSIDYSRFAKVEASNYNYILVKIRPDSRLTGTSVLGLFYSVGSEYNASPTRYVSQSITLNGKWQYLLFRMTGASGWSGQLNSIRVDLYDNSGIPQGYTADIGFVALCKNLTEAKEAQKDIPPSTSIGYYPCFKGTHIRENVPSKAPGCTEAGYTSSVRCPLCGYVMTPAAVIPAAGHSYKDGYCTKCGDVDPEYVFYIPGDCDGDGKITAKDSNILKAIVMGSVGNNLDAADINNDGKINAIDVNLLRALIMGA